MYYSNRRMIMIYDGGKGIASENRMGAEVRRTHIGTCLGGGQREVDSNKVAGNSYVRL